MNEYDRLVQQRANMESRNAWRAIDALPRIDIARFRAAIKDTALPVLVTRYGKPCFVVTPLPDQPTATPQAAKAVKP